MENTDVLTNPLLLAEPHDRKAHLRFRSPKKAVIHSIDNDDAHTTTTLKTAKTTPKKTSEKSENRPRPRSQAVVPKRTKPVYYLFDRHTDVTAIVLLVCVFLITVGSYPGGQEGDRVSLQHVFYSGWITAVATGLGALPFFFLHDLDAFYKGLSNALAAGMMIAASYSLITEALEYQTSEVGLLDSIHSLAREYHPPVRTFCGTLLGLIFILVAKQVLDKYEDLSIESLVAGDPAVQDNSDNECVEVVNGSTSVVNKGCRPQSHHSAQRMALILVVMTLHSLSEGIGIGVSYGGAQGMTLASWSAALVLRTFDSGKRLGALISLSLAVHNVPEGLAVALALKSKRVSTLRTVLWAIFTSLPQPVFAIPAYLFVERFAPLLPVGLGFAAGAMCYVALGELLVEAIADTQSTLLSLIVAAAACMAMWMLQGLLVVVGV